MFCNYCNEDKLVIANPGINKPKKGLKVTMASDTLSKTKIQNFNP